MYRLDLFNRKKDYLSATMPYGMIIGGESGNTDEKKAAIVINKNGTFQTTWSYRGPDLESSILEQLAVITAQINNSFHLFGTGWIMYFEAQRSPSVAYAEDVYFTDPVTKAIDDARKKKFASGRFFESNYFLTLCWIPPSDQEGRLKQIFIEGRKEYVTVDDNLSSFSDVAYQLFCMFKELDIPVDFLDKNEMATYLHSCVSSRTYPVKVPDEPTLMDQYLYDDPLDGGNTPKLGNKFMKVIVPKKYPGGSVFGMLNELNRLAFPYRWVTRYYCQDKSDVLSELKHRQTRWSGKIEPFMAMVKRLLFSAMPSTKDRNENAVMKVVELKEALRSVDAGEISFGFYSTAVIVLDENYECVCSAAKAVRDVFRNLGMNPQIEDIGSVDAWMGCVPGNLAHFCRRPYISTGNLIHMMPISDIWAGPPRNKHLKGPALMYTRSEGETLFRVNLHISDVGHTVIVGPTGAGKSVLLNMIFAQFRKYKGARVLIFDKGASSRVLTEAVGGNFFDLANNTNGLSFQPLAKVDDENERMWLLGWLCDYLESVHMAVTPELAKYISEALTSMASLPIQHRTMLNLCASVQNKELKVAFQPLTIEGDYGSIFDANEDNLSFSSWQSFEMEQLITNTPKIISTTLMYIFHRIDEEVKRDVRPTIIGLDEGWVFFDNLQFAAKIREWLKVLRKSNASVVFATQSLADIVASPIFTTVLESCPSRIFLPNKDAFDDTPTGKDKPSFKEMYQAFGLNERQIMMLAKAVPKKQYYYTSPHGCRMFELQLDPLELAFVGVGTADIKECQRIHRMCKGEDFVHHWLKYKDLPEDLIPLYDEDEIGAEQ